MSELTPKGKRALIVTGIAVAVLIIAGIWFQRALERTSAPSVPEPGRTETPPEFSGSLPYSDDGFSVDYIEASGSYIISIYAEPVEDNKQKALRFLESRGADPATSKIEYFYGPDVSNHTGP